MGIRDAIRVAAADRSSTRVFTVGLSPAVDRPGLSRLAAIKRGRFTLIDGADMEGGRMAELIRQIAAPGLTHLSLEAQGGTLMETYPRVLPDLYPGQDLRVVARVDARGPVRLTLKADAQGGGPVALHTTFDPTKGPRRPWVGKLWARERVSDLLEEMALGGEAGPLREETIQLALAYNLVTPYTSFLAIPASEVLNPEAAATLAEARRLKALVLAHNPDALALASPGGGGAADAASAPAEPMYAPPSTPGSAPPPSAEAAAQVHGRGCAGCEVGGDDRPPAPSLVALAGAALLVARLRRRPRR
jgi:Ca-activated chloride channel family protein